jgi:hypothetical protein
MKPFEGPGPDDRARLPLLRLSEPLAAGGNARSTFLIAPTSSRLISITDLTVGREDGVHQSSFDMYFTGDLSGLPWRDEVRIRAALDDLSYAFRGYSAR